MLLTRYRHERKRAYAIKYNKIISISFLCIGFLGFIVLASCASDASTLNQHLADKNVTKQFLGRFGFTIAECFQKKDEKQSIYFIDIQSQVLGEISTEEHWTSFLSQATSAQPYKFSLSQ